MRKIKQFLLTTAVLICSTLNSWAVLKVGSTFYKDKLCFTVTAVGVDVEGNNYQYVKVAAASGFSETYFRVPYKVEYDGVVYSVDEIDKHGFNNETTLETVTISSGVRHIDSYAFQNCENLKTVVLIMYNNDSKTFDDYAFSNCPNLKNVYVEYQGSLTISPLTFNKCPNLVYKEYENAIYFSSNPSSSPYREYAYLVKATSTDITSCTIHSDCEAICKDAFSGCDKLSKVEFASTEQFFNIAFADPIDNPHHLYINGSEITNLEIPNSVTTLSYTRYSGNAFLKTVKIPSTVTAMSALCPFYDCSSLTAINVNANNNNFISVDGILFNKEKTRIHGYPSAKEGESYTVPEGVTTIYMGAFYGSTNLKSVTIPESVTSVNNMAFTNCTNLEAITFESATPPQMYSHYNTFDNSNNCPIYVPTAEAVTAYKNATGMSKYADRIQVNPANTMPVVSESNYQSLGLSSDYIGYYAISNVDELYLFAKIVNYNLSKVKNAVLISDITVNNNVLKTDGTGALNGNGSNFRKWTPIGTRTNKYEGKFDGNGHTIKGLYYNDDNASYVGLFGYSNNATIENVSVIDSYFRGKQNVGGFCGYIDGSTKISNCYNAATVYASNPTIAANGTGDSNAGGICGYMTGSSVIENCHNAGFVSAYVRCVGGICGIQINGTITNSYNTGKVYSDAANSTGRNGYIGGITGWMTGSAKIIKCYNTGNVETKGICAGGIISYAYSANNQINNCYNIGTVKAYKTAGGICGLMNGATDNNYYLENCATNNDGSAAITLGGTSKTADEFAYGAVALLLNNGTNEGPWFQAIGEDASPVLDKTHGRVGILVTNGNTITVSGNYVFTQNYTVPAGKTLVIPADASVRTVGSAVITNSGTIKCNGTISGNNLDGAGSFVYDNNIVASDITFNATNYTYKGSAYTLDNGLDVTVGRTMCGQLFTYLGTATVTYQNNVNVGANATATWNETITKTFAIAPKEITVNATAQNREYNGTTSASGSISLSGIVGNDNVSATYTSATFADKKVGEGKTVTFSGIALAGNDAANYTLGEQTTATATANITAKTLSFSSITAANKVFDGNAETTVSIVASNIVNGDVVTFGTAAAFADESAGNNKAVSFTFSKSGADAANYAFANENGEATANIEPKEVSLIWSNTNLIYNGDNQVATATAGDLVSGYDCTVTVSGEQKNHGTYTATATALSSSNYKLPAAASSEFTIAPRDLTISTFSAGNKTYNGNAVASGSFTFGSELIEGDDVNVASYTATFADKNVGTGKTVSFSNMVLGGNDAANYNLTTASGTANADITAKEVSLTWSNTSLTYNGAEQVATATAVGLESGDVCTVNVIGAKKDQGTYTAEAESLDNNNYKLPEAKTKQFTIAPKEVSLTWSNTNLIYNGENQVATATAGNLVSGDVCTVTVSGANKDQGTHTATATVLSNANYKLPIVASQEFTIAPKEVSLAWSNTEFVYNGENQVATATAEGLISGDACTVNVIGAKKDQGTYTAEAESLSNANYKLPEAKTAQFTIKPKEVSLAWSNTALTYNGENQVAAATAEGLIGEDVCTVTVEGAEKNVGNYTAIATALSNDNYKLPEAVTSAFSIAPKEVSLAWSNTSLTYNGNEQVATVIAEGLIGNDECTVTVEGAAKNVGNHTATATALSNDNYKLPEAVTSAFSIAPKEVSLAWSNTSLIYNGNAQVAFATAEGLETGDECAVTVSGEQTNVGTYTATAESLSNSNYKLPEVASSEFAIAAKTGVMVTVTENSKDVVYNTEEQSVEGYTVSIADELNIYAESDFTFSGNAVAKGTAAGKYAMELSATDFENKNGNYVEVEFVIVDGALTIKKAAEAPNKPEATIETRYINTQLVALPENWKWAEYAALVEGDNTATANYDGADKGNYEVESVAVSIKRLPCLHNEGNELLYTLAPTCTHKGYEGNQSCKLCGQIYKYGDSIPALGHAYDTVIVAVTCTADGYKELTCTRCGDITHIDIVPATGHTDSVAYEHIVAATCTVAGSQDSVVYCSVCKEELSRKTVEIPALGHTAGEPVVENFTAPTCTEAGAVDTVVYCTIDNAEISRVHQVIPALGHEAGRKVAENYVASTATTEGSVDSVVYCTRCNAEISRETFVIPVSDHEHIAGAPVVENYVAPTCTVAGSVDTAVYCTVNGELLSRTTTVLPALGHKADSIVKENVIAATFEAAGSYELVTYCSVCGEEISRTKVEVPQLVAPNFDVEVAISNINYTVGDSLNLEGGKLIFATSDSTTAEVVITPEMVSGFNPDSVGVQTVTVSFEIDGVPYTTTFDVTVKDIAKPVEAEVVISQINYTVGDSLNLEGGKLIFATSDSTTAEVVITPEMVSGFNPDSVGVQTVMVSFEIDGVPYTTTFEVEVKEAEVIEIVAKSIAVSAKPAKVEYKQGEALDVTGGKLTITFSDNTTKDVDLKADMVSGFDASKVGEQKLTVNYIVDGVTLTATFSVTVTKEDDNTAIDDTDALVVNIFAYGNTIVVENATDDIYVYNAMGALIDRVNAEAGRTEIIVNGSEGIYIVKTGNTVKRVMVK